MAKFPQTATSSSAVSVLESKPHTILQPLPSLHTSFLQLAKRYIDPLASEITDAQEARQKAERASRKRKRRTLDHGGEEQLKMRKIYTDGFDVNQVWQQTRRVLDAGEVEVENELPVEDDEDDDHGGVNLNQAQDPTKAVRFEEDRLEVGSSDDEVPSEDDGDDLGQEGVDLEIDEGQEEDDEGLSDEGSVDLGSGTEPSELGDAEGPPEATAIMVKDKFGLNDEFFSIDDFNKQSQFMEQADAKGEDDGAASDEEDVDWTADPLMGGLQPAKQQQQSKGNASRDTEDVDDVEEDEDEEEEGEGGGPTFGDMDLDAPAGDSDEDDDASEQGIDGLGDMGNTNEILYSDFFAPPPRAPGKKQTGSKFPQGSSYIGKVDGLATEDNSKTGDATLDRAMSSVHRDLFDDELSVGDDPDAERDPQDASAKQNLSSHERRQLALRAEIRRLEAANVGPKDWSLAGESLAPARPQNSLLEEDLDFERTGKPAPVVTDAVNEDIEALIKRRILAREFNEVVRRRPTDLVTGQQKRRGLAKLSDNKPSKGLAEEYAEEHLRQNDPNFVDQRSEALKAKHADIEKHFAAVSRDLDILSNLHYKPKPSESNVEVRADAPKISMEEARPSVADAGGEDSVLAPQEIYKAGEQGRQQGEVMTKGGTAVNREEQTREQKKRIRRREKERTRKASGNAGPTATAATGTAPPRKNKKAERNDVVNQLGKGGVKVIDKKGDLRDVQGKAVHEKAGRDGVGNLKL